MVQEIGVAGLLLLLFGVLCPGWIELAGGDDSLEPGSTGHFVGVGIIATGCSGSLGVTSRSLRLVNRSGYELMFSSSLVALGN